jgi:hypothetical protein
MRIANILTQIRRQPPQLLIGITCFLMAVGFCLQNAKLIPSLPGEYQPLIFLVGCCLAILIWPVPKPARTAAIVLFSGILLSLLVHAFLVEPKLPSTANLLRLAPGPIMLAGTAAAWQKIDCRWLWGIFTAGLMFAAVGTVNSNLTTLFVSTLGVRINDGGTAYASWAAFFFAEYSYAALAFAAVFAWLNARTEPTNHQRWLALAIAILLIGLTRSGTGFALIGIILLSQLRPRYWGIGLAILGATFFLSPRIERLTIGLWQISQGNLEQFVVIDGSTTWRFLSNLLALKVELVNPWGTMSFDLKPFNQILQFDNVNTQKLINLFFADPKPVAAQGILFNYGLFGGVILQTSLCLTFALALLNTSSFRRDQTILLGLLVLYTFFVQSGLTSPVPWILLGIWLSPPEKC